VSAGKLSTPETWARDTGTFAGLNFLAARKYTVKVNNSYSRWNDVISGIPRECSGSLTIFGIH